MRSVFSRSGYARGADRFRVVICGGSIAAVEGLLRLRRLVGDAVHVTLVAPNDELRYRPVAVQEPFSRPSARRYPLRKIVRHTDAEWVQEALEWVDPDGQVAHSADGRIIPYDALLLAVGAERGSLRARHGFRRRERRRHLSRGGPGRGRGLHPKRRPATARRAGMATAHLRACAHDRGTRREHGHGGHRGARCDRGAGAARRLRSRCERSSQ